MGTVPDLGKEFCQDIPEVYLQVDSGWAIGAMTFSATGILVTLFVMGVFVKWVLFNKFILFKLANRMDFICQNNS